MNALALSLHSLRDGTRVGAAVTLFQLPLQFRNRPVPCGDLSSQRRWIRVLGGLDRRSETLSKNLQIDTGHPLRLTRPGTHLRRRGRIERRPSSHLDALEYIEPPRAPEPSLTDGQSNQRSHEHPLAVFGVLIHIMFIDPCLYSVSVLRSGRPHTDQKFGLRQQVLIQRCGPLGNECDTDTARSTTAHEIVNGPHTTSTFGSKSLWSERIRLIDHQV